MTNETKEVNKILCNVTKVSTSFQDRHIMTLDVWVDLESGGSLSCFNNVLCTYDKDKQKRVGTAYGLEMIRQCLDFFGVDDLSEVRNYKCYILTDKDRIRFAGDVLGLEQLPFTQYKNNRQQIIKKDIFDKFVGDGE